MRAPIADTEILYLHDQHNRREVSFDGLPCKRFPCVVINRKTRKALKLRSVCAANWKEAKRLFQRQVSLEKYRDCDCLFDGEKV